MTPLLKHINLIINSVFDFIYPPLCLNCGNSLSEQEELICEKCWNATPFNENYFSAEDINSITGPLYFSEFHWCFSIDENILKIIHNFKYSGFKKLKYRLGEFLVKRIYTIINSQPVDLIVPVPLHKKREKSRGYNQSALLCEAIIGKLNVPYSSNILKKTVNNKSQTSLTRDERAQNVKGVFAIEDVQEIKNKHVLIIDDVFTTGSTINECSKVLMENDAKRITALTVIYATPDFHFTNI